MKYTAMGFSQEKLVNYGLDMKDAVILRYFIDFKGTNTMRTEIIDDEVYYWVRYEGIVNEYPILNLNNEDSIYRRLKKLVKVNILKHKTIKSFGTYSYYTLGENYIDLISGYEKEADNQVKNIEKNFNAYENNLEDSNNLSDENMSIVGCKSLEGTDNYPTATGCKSVPNNPSTINPSIKNNQYIKKTEENIKKQNITKVIVDYLNLKANTNYKHTTALTIKNIKARFKEGFILEDFYKVIDNKLLDWKGTDMEKFLRPETLFGNKFEGYLNENITLKKEKHNPVKAVEISTGNAGMYKLLD
ncbi:conserved phage C-terminal domain-containing protein [Clostridium sp. YIM B02505]|uniref:Conserved phage C-terminal domain-containing protein n=1 Tax=Clostridium yunnanense TaxID=2800325 RepID=A0ABS1EMU9_9CLOT|nr:conserved phage C-terminal domain-containing protein [Clostridium yunnanense]MBK1810705.1 conserved phage C-terminal domain-containing protein [Clostridium yunnanense]